MDKCKRIVRLIQNISMTELIMIHSKLNEVLKEKQYIYYMHFSHDKYYDCLCVNIDIEGKKREFTDEKPDIGDTTPITYNDQSALTKCVIDAVDSTSVKEDGSISGKQIESIFNE